LNTIPYGPQHYPPAGLFGLSWLWTSFGCMHNSATNFNFVFFLMVWILNPWLFGLSTFISGFWRPRTSLLKMLWWRGEGICIAFQVWRFVFVRTCCAAFGKCGNIHFEVE
jgi:hypothetical protein